MNTQTDVRTTVEKNFLQIQRAIQKAASRSDRCADQIRLIAVSKRQPIESIQAYLDICDQYNYPAILGENYVQEFRQKVESIGGEYRAHCIGHLQSNKARDAVQLFDVIETLDSMKLARALSKEAGKIGKEQQVFVQVNISCDGDKSGVEPGELLSFVTEELRNLPSLVLKGFMTITRNYSNPEDARSDFKAMRKLLEQVQDVLGREDLELSMGMSADFDIAIEEGATMVRVGTALFGERD